MSYSKTNPRFCHSCRLVQSHCICSLFHKYDFPVKIWLKQDTKERSQKNNTGYWVTQLLENCEFHDDSNEFPLEWIQTLSRSPGDFGVLFPSEDAVELDSETWGLRKHLIVLDSTWNRAQSQLIGQDCLKSLQKFKLSGEEGQFLIRKPPVSGALSTIEAVNSSFSRILGSQPKDSPLDAFSQTVQIILEHRISLWTTQLKYLKSRNF